jgi:lycopene cyclase domain-containing protein
MTYFGFHLVFILPLIGVLLYLVRQQGTLPYPRAGLGLLLICAIALVYTTPWDNYLVAQEIWTYDEGRILEQLRIGYVPLEEYLFFVLQPILTTGFLFFFAQRRADVCREAAADPTRQWGPRLAGGILFLGVAAAGCEMLRRPAADDTYLGLILAWAAPVLAFQAFFGMDRILRFRTHLVPALVGSTAYLWLVDSIAITWQIWHITETTSTGYHLFALPVEEAVFFLVTNLLVLFGLILLYDLLLRRQGARRAAPPSP